MTFPDAPDTPDAPDRRQRRRTVLVSSRWAASAAVVAAMTLGAGALAPGTEGERGTSQGAQAAQSARSDSPVREASSSSEAPYVSSTVTEESEEPTENTP